MFIEEEWSLATILSIIIPAVLYYLITLTVYGIQSRNYPIYFAPRSPLLTICASLLGFCISFIGVLRRYNMHWIPCLAVHWVMYIGFISWQLLIAARAYRLYCAINRHAFLVEIAPWQVNNTGYLDASWIKQNQSKRTERRFYIAIGATILVTAIVALVIQIIIGNNAKLALEDYLYSDPKTHILYYIRCRAMVWNIYPFFTIWGLIMMYTVPAGIYYLRHYPDHFGIRMELAAISVITLITFIGYLAWSIIEKRISLLWPGGMFIITHSISTLMPLYEAWKRQRLAKLVTNVKFEETFNCDNDVWRAFCQYAARDFCAENVCFVEQYRKLIQRTEQAIIAECDENDDVASQPSMSTEQNRHCRRSSSLQLHTSYAKRLYSRLLHISRDGISSRVDHGEANELINMSPLLQQQTQRQPRKIRRLLSADNAKNSTTFDTSAFNASVLAETALPNMSALPMQQRPHSQSLPSGANTTATGDEKLAFTGASVADIDQRAIPLSDQPDAQVPMSLISAYRVLFETFIVDGAPLQLNISHAARVRATSKIRSYAYTIGMYAEVYAEIKWSLWINTFPKFLQAYERDLIAANDVMPR
ncbi:hypothetical protein BDF19DRAFT_437147 [Syncephalis fuscata]|nr:hypothetical protein BDF19DRAFT_437147 [Syncephalis fuscata]